MGNENSSSYYSSTRDRAQVKDCPAMSFVFVFVFVLVFVFVGRSTSAQGTQSAVAEARRQTEGKYNIVCIKAGHNYDISGIMPTMYKSQVSFNALQNKHSNIHGHWSSWAKKNYRRSSGGTLWQKKTRLNHMHHMQLAPISITISINWHQ